MDSGRARRARGGAAGDEHATGQHGRHSQAVSDAALARIDAAIADLPALDAAFAPPVCRLDGSQPREEGTQG